MSAVERIRQTLNQQQADAKKRRAIVDTFSEKQQLQNKAGMTVNPSLIEAESRKRNERHLFVVKQTEKILNESGVLAELQQIDQEVLSKTSFVHGLIYNPHKYRGASLIWGENVKIDENGIEVFDKYHDASWSFIKVYINPDNEDLFIEGDKLEKSGWRNKERIGSTLADAYFHPRSNSYHYEPFEPEDDGVHGQDSGR